MLNGLNDSLVLLFWLKTAIDKSHEGSEYHIIHSTVNGETVQVPTAASLDFGVQVN